MTARYALRTAPDGTLLLATRARKRAGFALGFLLLVGATAAGFDPTRDLSGSRAPLTILVWTVGLACLGAALATRRTTIDPCHRTIVTERRVAGLRLGGERVELGGSGGLRISRPGGERGPYQLELEHAGGTLSLDSSSWLSELEPVGRRIAEALDLPLASPAGR